jgi:hypothetical protein
VFKKKEESFDYMKEFQNKFIIKEEIYYKRRTIPGRIFFKDTKYGKAWFGVHSDEGIQ